LWPVNVRFMKAYGAKQAGLDVFRIFLQRLSNSELNYGMRYQLIKEEDILKASMGEDIRLNVTDSARRIFKKKVKQLYEEYPTTPKDMPKWKNKIVELFAEAKRTL